MKKKRTRLKDLTNQKFGLLTVIDRAPNKKNWTMWNCVCDCGNKTTTYSTHLIRENVKSCGCNAIKKGSNHVQWTGFGEISGKRWNSIRRINQKGERKSRQNISFEIDIKFAWELFLKQNRKCALSGIELTFKPKTASLDRIDNSKGYLENNVQWVHKDINRMKNIFDNQYFIDTCKRIANNYGGCEI
ncbi:MAG: hypothetical protein WD512_11205 [Candidatus Paceibacterota bacterium]